MNPLESWTEEQRCAFLYRACAQAEQGTRRELFRRLAGEAEAHAAIWRAQLTSRGLPAPGPYAPDARTRLVARMVGTVGPRLLRRVLLAMNVRGMATYADPDELQGREPVGCEPWIRERERTPETSGRLRARLIGVGNGLVGNGALIMAFAGATSDPRLLALAGVAGLCAGALSMACGEYVSMRSQRERHEHPAALERQASVPCPEAEARELALTYTAKGIAPREAARLAQMMMADCDHPLDALAHAERVRDRAVPGSPSRAAAGAFLSFSAGALVPAAPLLALPASYAMTTTLGVSAIALVALGMRLALFAGASPVHAGVRMLALGGGAASVSYAVGRLLGVAL